MRHPGLQDHHGQDPASEHRHLYRLRARAGGPAQGQGRAEGGDHGLHGHQDGSDPGHLPRQQGDADDQGLPAGHEARVGDRVQDAADVLAPQEQEQGQPRPGEQGVDQRGAHQAGGHGDLGQQEGQAHLPYHVLQAVLRQQLGGTPQEGHEHEDPVPGGPGGPQQVADGHRHRDERPTQSPEHVPQESAPGSEQDHGADQGHQTQDDQDGGRGPPGPEPGEALRQDRRVQLRGGPVRLAVGVEGIDGQGVGTRPRTGPGRRRVRLPGRAGAWGEGGHAQAPAAPAGPVSSSTSKVWGMGARPARCRRRTTRSARRRWAWATRVSWKRRARTTR